MKINPNYKLEQAVDESKPRLAFIHVTKHHAVATNGYILAVVPAQLEENDTQGWLTSKILKAARKLCRSRSNTVDIGLNGSQTLIDGSQCPRPEYAKEQDNTPHKIGAMLTDAARNSHFTIGIDASKLSQLADALGTDKLALTFSTSPKHSIFVRAIEDSKAYGIIMPINVSQ